MPLGSAERGRNWHTERIPSLSGGLLGRPFAQHTVEAPAPPERVWALWSDPQTWPSFYPGLASVRSSESFKMGAVLALFPSGGSRPQRFEILFLEAGRAFTLVRRLPLATLRLHHRIDACELGCRLHLRLDLDGPLGWIYGLAKGRSWKAALPLLLRTLAKAAQQT